MSFLLRQVAHCDVCGHEWLVVADSIPKHCAKCKSRKWNKSAKDFQEWAYPAALAASDKLSPRPAPHVNKHAQTCKCLMCKPPKG
jgi:hypothetical protein